MTFGISAGRANKNVLISCNAITMKEIDWPLPRKGISKSGFSLFLEISVSS